MPIGEPPPRFDQILRQAAGKARERKRFDAVCREAIRGKSRDEAREIIIEEYRKVGKQPPGQPILDRRVDILLAPRTPESAVTGLVEGVSMLVGAATRFKRMLQDSSVIDEQVRHRPDLFLKPDWHRTCRVDLVDDAQSWIGVVPLTGILSFRDISMIMVNVQATAPQDEGGALLVKVGERTVGSVAGAGSEPLWEVLEVKIGDEFPVGSTSALRTQDSDGLWRLDLGAPEEVRHWPQFDDRQDDGEV